LIGLCNAVCSYKLQQLQLVTGISVIIYSIDESWWAASADSVFAV